MAGIRRPDGWAGSDLSDVPAEYRAFGMVLRSLARRGLAVCVQRSQAKGKLPTRYQLTVRGRKAADRLLDPDDGKGP